MELFQFFVGEKRADASSSAVGGGGSTATFRPNFQNTFSGGSRIFLTGTGANLKGGDTIMLTIFSKKLHGIEKRDNFFSNSNR